MMKIRAGLLCLSFACLMTGCSTGRGQYSQNWQNLEKPPGIVVSGQNTNSLLESSSEGSNSRSRERLSVQVYRIDGHPTEMMLKADRQEAWLLLLRVIRQNKIHIINKNQQTGEIKVAYKSGGFLDGFSLLGNSAESDYLLTILDKGEACTISARKIEEDDTPDPSALKDGAPIYAYDNSEKLIATLFETFQNGLSE